MGNYHRAGGNQMSQQQDDGGPAFPTETVEYGNGNFKYGKKGMSLRDYFAGQAITGLLAVVSGSKTDEAYFANHSYKIADAMLEARTKQD